MGSWKQTIAYRSSAACFWSGVQRQRVKLAAHPALEGGVNHLVLGDAGFAGEGG